MRPLVKLLTFVFLLIHCSTVFSQKISIKADKKPLNLVLVEIRDRYHLQVSFNDSKLSSYFITANNTFSTPDDAFNFLLKGLPLKYEKRDQVYLFYSSSQITGKPDSRIDGAPSRPHLLAGIIINKLNSEELPFSSIQVNGFGMVSDNRGTFSYISKADSIFRLKISYLGFYIMDTIVGAGTHHIFGLMPSVVELNRVIITGKSIDYSIQSGDMPGMVKINHKIANFLPGFSDNSIFNLLRLQPGILASGEQTNDLVIWGSYEGQSQVLFDGITIFGLKNFNDNISSVNPLMVKDINVEKGGFGANLGERVGGIVNVNGADDNFLKPSAKLSINNMTLSGMGTVPIGKNASAALAFRQTYYDLYSKTNLSSLNDPGSNNGQGSTLNVYPDYVFHDLNFKVSGKSPLNNAYYLSFFAGGDKFNYNLSQTRQVRTNGNHYDIFNVNSATDEYNRQLGISSFYGKVWKNGNTSNLTAGYSQLSTSLDDSQKVISQSTGNTEIDMNETTSNYIHEYTLKLDNKFAISHSHTIEVGSAFINDNIELKKDSAQITSYQKYTHAGTLAVYLLDEIKITRRLSVRIGGRGDQPTNISKIYWQPRISASYKLNETLKINGSWGRYNQFVMKTSVTDEDGNYHYFWATSDNKDIPVLQSTQRVLGINFTHNDFTVNIEGYYKRIYGITRYVQNRAGLQFVYQGDSKGMGLDVLVKKDYKGNSAWVCYSLGRTLEFFPYFPDNNYRRAPQDQMHEIKAAGLLNLSPFFLSANYVYGSGFPNQAPLAPSTISNPDYHRFDVSATYQLSRRAFNLQAGISILNLFNTHNIKYSNFVRLPASQTNTINIYAEAVPFTPTLFLNVKF